MPTDAAFMGNVSHLAAVFVLAAAPISELRGAIPLGIVGYHLSAGLTYAVATLGNLVPPFLIYGVGRAWIALVRRRKGFFERLTDAVLRRTERKFNGRYAKYGLIALPLFVAVPLPMTGAWTGALAAFLLGIPFRKALPAVALGVLVAGVIVTLAVTGAVEAFGVFL